MATGTTTIGRIAARLLITTVLLGSLPAIAQQDSPIREQDRTVYDALYREKLSSVNRTRDGADDMTLAQEMLAFAKDVPDDPGVQCLIYIDVITLAANASEIGVINEAAARLYHRWPEQDAVSPEELMQLASRAYRSVERSDRMEQGEHYIKLLLAMTNYYSNKEDFDQASSICRLANTIARTIDSNQSDFIEQEVKRLTAASNLARRLKMLELSVQKNPQNKPAAKELVQLLVTHRDDMDAALKYVASTSDEELIDLVGHCAKGIDEADAAAALRVADWYVALAEDAEDGQELALLRRAHAWYGRFYALYNREDALAKHVASRDGLVKLKIENLEKDNPNADKDGWITLTAPPYDVTKQVVEPPKLLETDGAEILIDDGLFYVPIPKANSYEVRITLTTPNPKDRNEDRAIYADLPIGDNYFIRTRHYVKGGSVVLFSHVEEKVHIQDALPRTGVKIQCILQVSKTDDQVAIAALVNGKLAASWKGALEQLDDRDEGDIDKLPIEKGSVMLIHSKTPVRIHSIEYRPRD